MAGEEELEDVRLVLACLAGLEELRLRTFPVTFHRSEEGAVAREVAARDEGIIRAICCVGLPMLANELVLVGACNWIPAAASH